MTALPRRPAIFPSGVQESCQLVEPTRQRMSGGDLAFGAAEGWDHYQVRRVFRNEAEECDPGAIRRPGGLVIMRRIPRQAPRFAGSHELDVDFEVVLSRPVPGESDLTAVRREPWCPLVSRDRAVSGVASGPGDSAVALRDLVDGSGPPPGL